MILQWLWAQYICIDFVHLWCVSALLAWVSTVFNFITFDYETIMFPIIIVLQNKYIEAVGFGTHKFRIISNDSNR